jgi:hypothetical protein
MNREDIRAAILSSEDYPREPADQPWVDEKLWVRGISANDKDMWVQAHMPDGESFVWGEHATAELVARTLITEDGERVFTDEDIEALGTRDGRTLSALFQQAMRLSGMDGAEEIEAAFSGAPNGASSSG